MEGSGSVQIITDLGSGPGTLLKVSGPCIICVSFGFLFLTFFNVVYCGQNCKILIDVKTLEYRV